MCDDDVCGSSRYLVFFFQAEAGKRVGVASVGLEDWIKGQWPYIIILPGKKVVIYFYPKDDTPGCTKEACGIRDAYDGFLDKDIVVFGISYDSAEAHQSFIKKYNLPFNLLSDSDKSVSRLYGTEGTFFPMRKTFLIDEMGTVKKIYSKVSVVDHGREILSDFSISK